MGRVLAVLSAALVFAGAAGASNGTQRIVVERVAEPYAFVVSCSDYGPYAFENIVEGTMLFTVTEVFAGDGALLQTVFQIVFRETDTNSVSGKVLPLHAAVHEVWDYGSNTREQDGVVAIGRSPDGGTYIREVGRIVMTLDTREVQFLAGPHPAFFNGGIEPAVCAELASV